MLYTTFRDGDQQSTAGLCVAQEILVNYRDGFIILHVLLQEGVIVFRSYHMNEFTDNIIVLCDEQQSTSWDDV